MRYDTIVIGSGPAGLSAALTLKIRNKNVLVIGNEKVSGKVKKAHEINNYLGLPAISGEAMADAMTSHATSMEVEIVDDQVFTVYAMGDYFSLQTVASEMYEARTVIVATGVSFGKTYPGETTFLGRGVSYCATCDALLYRGKKVVIIGASQKDEDEAKFMSELCSQVIYVPLYDNEVTLPDNIIVLRDVPVEIIGGVKATALVLKGQTIEADGIFILRESVPASQLVPGIVMDDKHIAVNRKMETNIPGCFAAGDITGVPYQYIKAAGEGNIAAISAVNYLDRRN